MTLIARDVCARPTASSPAMWDVVIAGEGSMGKVDVPSQEIPTVSHGASYDMCSAAGADVKEGGWCPSSVLQNLSPALGVADRVETRRLFQENHLWAGRSAFPLPRGQMEGKEDDFFFFNIYFLLLPFVITAHFHGTGKGCLQTPACTLHVVRSTFSLGMLCSSNNRFVRMLSWAVL